MAVTLAAAGNKATSRRSLCQCNRGFNHDIDLSRGRLLGRMARSARQQLFRRLPSPLPSQAACSTELGQGPGHGFTHHFKVFCLLFSKGIPRWRNSLSPREFPPPREYHGVATAAGFLYVFGGTGDSGMYICCCLVQFHNCLEVPTRSLFQRLVSVRSRIAGVD